MPKWFAPVLAITTIVMVLTGLRVARDEGLIKKESNP
jgi:hypothetical protein